MMLAVKNLKMRRNRLTVLALTALLISLATPIVTLPASASGDESNDNIKVLPEKEHWLKLESPIITALFPRGGEKPMFIWWYTNQPDQVYVVKFQGLIEWLAIDHSSLPNPDYYSSLRNASAETWSERFDDWYFKPTEQQYMTNMQMRMMLLSIVQQMMTQMELMWHRPFLDFSAAQWSLSDISNITASDGKIIGVAFAFTLVKVPEQPRFQFAENNIMLRIRFYNTTVQETVPGTSSSYTVNAGEMKMDLVINKWVWNLDSIKALVTNLQNEGFNISIPNMKSRLALWVNLLINITRTSLTEAQEQPEAIEDHSTSTVMEVDDHTKSMGIATAQEEPIETSHPIVRIQFANQTETLAGFFRFVAQAKITNYPNQGDVNMVPVKAAFRPAGTHMKLFLAYPYFGNGTLEHDPSIGVNIAGIDTSPKYSVQSPSGSQITPTVLGDYVPPLFTPQLMIALIVVISGVALLLYAIRWRRRTPVNMVGPSTSTKP